MKSWSDSESPDTPVSKLKSPCHSTVGRLVCQHYEMRYLPDAIEVFTRYYQSYNYRRIMTAIDYQTHCEVLNHWAVSEGRVLPQAEQSLCMQTNFNPTLNLTNHTSDLPGL